MRIKIVSNGTSQGTKVVNAETNEVIEGIQEIDWNVGIYHPMAVARLKFIKVPVEIETTSYDTSLVDKKL